MARCYLIAGRTNVGIWRISRGRLDEDVLDDWLWAMDIELGGQAEPATGE